MTVKKTAKTWAEISMTVVDFTIFRLQLELCFAVLYFLFFFYLNIAIVLINYSPEYSVSLGAKRP